MTLVLRKAREDDARLLFDWANDSETRDNSFSTSHIPWPDHERWFNEHIQSDNYLIFIAGDDQGNDVGLIRFERLGDHAVVGLSVAKTFRGKGLGTELLNKGCEEVFAEWEEITFVRAKVKAKNERSCRICTRAGFLEEQRDSETVVYRRSKG